MDSSYFKDSGFSGSAAKKLRTALRFLGLIDDQNVPTVLLQRLHRALRGVGSDSKTAVLHETLENSYPLLFAKDFSLKRATWGQLEERFERMGAGGTIRRYCISFFLHMAVDTGIELSPHLAGKSRLGIGRKSAVLKSRERRRKTAGGAAPDVVPSSEAEWTGLPKLHPALIGLLRELPSPGLPWDAQEKTGFKKAFEALLDVIYLDRAQ